MKWETGDHDEIERVDARRRGAIRAAMTAVEESLAQTINWDGATESEVHVIRAAVALQLVDAAVQPFRAKLLNEDIVGHHEARNRKPQERSREGLT